MELVSPEHLRRIERTLWAAALVALPVTSFRFMPFMGPDSQVRPLSLIPAVLLLFVIAFHSVRERRILLWSSSFQPLLAFILILAISSAIGFLLAPPDLYSYSYASRLSRAWVTLGVGMIFLIVPMSMNRDEEDLKFTLKWLYVGFAGHVTWSLIQLIGIYLLHSSDLIDAVQKTVSMAGLSPNNRISGLALEPSWLASQVMTLYLPWAFAAAAKDHHWSNRRWLVPAILTACVFLMVFTFSRGGILTAFASIILTFIIAGWDRVRQAWKWFTTPLRGKSIAKPNKALELSLRITVIIAILTGLVGGAYILSRNRYFSQIWQSKKNTLVEYFVDIYAGPRLAYAWAGWTIFEQHPWTGVGLGAVGLYMHQAFPDWAHFNVSEIAQLLSSDNSVYPNTKNLYVRLLAETGILGFWLFISFYLLLLGRSLKLLRSRQKKLVFIGTASLLALFAIAILNLTLDSLAMPDIWLPLGILIGITDSRP